MDLKHTLIQAKAGDENAKEKILLHFDKEIFDVVYYLYCHFRYGFRLRRSTALFCLGQFVCLLMAVEYCYVVSPSAVEKYTIGGIAFVASASLSISRLARRSSLVRSLFDRFRR